jgi:integrase
MKALSAVSIAPVLGPRGVLLQVACSNEASDGRCGWRAGGKTCCARTGRSDESSVPLKLSTQHGYKAVLAKHLLPYWRDWQLREIGRQDVQQWVADKFKQQSGWQTVRNAWRLLSGILETAVEYGYLSMNPARGVKFPQQGAREAPAIIAGDEFAKLLNELGEPYKTMVELIAATGLRIGELLGLRWRTLDLDVGTLAVRESVYDGKLQRPKTQKSRRTIPLGPHAVASLKAHRDRSAREGDDELVFPNKSGEPLRDSKLLDHVLRPAAKPAGLGRVTWHQFRHIHSSLLNNLGVPVKIAQEQLGHSSSTWSIPRTAKPSKRSKVNCSQVSQIAGCVQAGRFGKS